jgi:hypothetical protein
MESEQLQQSKEQVTLLGQIEQRSTEMNPVPCKVKAHLCEVHSSKVRGRLTLQEMILG